MLEAMACEDGMALLDIDLHLVLQPEALEEAIDRGDIVIILMLHRLLRLGLDQDRAFEAHLVLIIDDHRQEAAHMFRFARQIGVQQGLIALTAAPEHIVLSAELDRRIHAGFHRGRREGEDIGIRVCRRARHEAPMREQIGRAPQKFGRGAFHLLADVIDDRFQITGILRKIRTFRADIGIMETEIRCLQDVEHLKGHIGLQFGQIQRIAEPWAIKGLPAERIAARPCETVPIGDRKAQMVFQGFSGDDLFRIVMAEREFVAALGSFKLDLRNIVEEVGHVSPRMDWAAAL